jgi:REP element-mobilizing transposase RayT
VEFAGAWHHVTSRGNERGAIFTTDGDRRHFLELVAEISQRYRCCIIGYVLMTNHYQLLMGGPRLATLEGV